MNRIIFLMVLAITVIVKDHTSYSENLESYSNTVDNEVAQVVTTQSQTQETKVQESFKTSINYLVREGDTLDSISKKFQLTTKELIELNGLSENAEMTPGQFLKIPLKVKKPQVGTVRRSDQEKDKIPPTEKSEINEVIEDQNDTLREEKPTVFGSQKETTETPIDSQAIVEDEVVNLQTEMDIKDLIQTMSELTGETFLMDDTVKGKKVTIITPQGGFKKENSLRLFETILDINGFSIVNKDGINKIIQKRDIKTESIPTKFGTSYKGSSDRFITRLVPLENIPAGEVANLLKPLISRDGDVAVYPDLNTLIIVESESNINRLLTIIENIDLKKEIQFIKIEHSDAAEVAAKLIDILGGTGSVSTGTQTAAPTTRRTGRTERTDERPPQTQTVRPIATGGQSSMPGFRVIVDERTNSLIVIAYPEDIPKINAMIRKLDVEIDQPEEGIYVIRLKNADAEQVVLVLSSLMGGGGISAPSQGISGRRSSGIGGTGGGSFSQPYGGFGRTVGGSSSQSLSGLGGGQQISRQETGDGAPSASIVTEEGLRITADPATNSIIFVGPRRAFEVVSRVIEDLDIRRKQVFVEAAILEVNINNITAFGTNLSIGFTFNGNNLGFGGTNLPGVPSLLGVAANPAASINLASTLSGLFLGVVGEEVDPDGSGPIPPIPSFTALFQALTSLTDVNVLSTPSIITTDNEEAEIIVADVIPFPTGSVVGDAGVTVQTIDRQPVGIRLAITPQISEGDFLNLNIYTEVSAIAPSPADLNTAEFGIATNTRTADSSVIVKNGQTIVIGGLVQDRKSIIQNRVPLLGSIPILGNLFKFKQNQSQKINLMILLTPRIIEDESDMQNILEERQKRNMLIQQKNTEQEKAY